MDNQEAIAMYTAGLPVRAICRELGIHPPKLYDILDENGVPRRNVAMPERAPEPIQRARPRKRFEVTEQRRDQVIELYHGQGLSGKRIAMILGWPHQRVLKVLHDARTEVVPGRPSNLEWRTLRDAVKDDLVHGIPVTEIMAKHGINAAVMNDLVRRVKIVERADFKDPSLYDSLVNEILSRITDHLGFKIVSNDSSDVQLKMF